MEPEGPGPQEEALAQVQIERLLRGLVGLGSTTMGAKPILLGCFYSLAHSCWSFPYVSRLIRSSESSQHLQLTYVMTEIACMSCGFGAAAF